MNRAVPLALLAALTAGAPTTPPAAEDYWTQQREGWFWYREPPAPKPQPTPKKKSDPKKRPELTSLEALQARLEELKRIAVMNPTDANMTAYMRLQQTVMRQAETFARRWQQLVWTTPSLDASVQARPTNAAAIDVFDRETQSKQEAHVRALASTHALIFVFRTDCPYCHRFAPILRRFEQTYGLRIYAVSLDGGGLPDFPEPRHDPALAARLAPEAVPALYLTEPARRSIQPVGFGLLAFNELLERIATLADAPDPRL
jgi:conjugal transfer pilus assembly protein TraF